MSSISINLLEGVNPFFDDPDLQNPKPDSEVNNLLGEWTNTGELDGISYTRNEVVDFLDEWDVLWEIATDQNPPKSELTQDDVGDCVESFVADSDLCSYVDGVYNCIKDSLSLSQLQIMLKMYGSKSGASMSDIGLRKSVMKGVEWK